MVETFNLNKVVLTEGVGLDKEGLRHSIGVAASDYLQQIVKDDNCVGVGWELFIYWKRITEWY